ncbi:2Fe-2S iron-sulfur cluster-binding protein [Devosia elaeis]|uniref:Oxidoreductase n=1 Tax=Devosia elaeis TaxID=1770058 RepID=A0A178I4Z3_9HYPH|nr:2Fe-2S iron-sulfur cluster-binding protein [Devosia elaeis]OAM83697.1 oxidoreductase [Devosia elaeis]
MATIQIENGPAFSCGPHDTIMRAAVRAGHGFPYECNAGSCGNCRFELLEGAVHHHRADSPAYGERDQRRNRWLGCQALPESDCRIKVRLDAHYESTYPPRKLAAELVDIAPITHDISEFTFRVVEAQQALPGQYALVKLPGMDAPRAYSMCEVSDDGLTWAFQIKSVPNGKASAVLARLHPGALVDIDGPYGMAYLREDADRDILCVAGGSGLSPMISVARAAARSSALAGRAIHFLYGGRMMRDLCGEPMLQALPGYGERIHYHPVLSAQPLDGAETWTGRQGFVHEAAAELFGERLKDMEVYFAGPPPMAEAIKRMLHDNAVPQGQVHFDEFY